MKSNHLLKKEHNFPDLVYLLEAILLQKFILNSPAKSLDRVSEIHKERAWGLDKNRTEESEMNGSYPVLCVLWRRD